MSKIIEFVMEVLFTAIVVIFLIVMMFQWRLSSGTTGVMGRMGDNGYNTVSDAVADAETTDSYQNMLADIEPVGIVYTGGVLSLYNPQTGANAYDAKSLFRLSFDGADYTWNSSTKKWTSGTKTRDFSFYIEDITSRDGTSVLFLATLEDLESMEDYPMNLIYNDGTNQLCFFTASTYTVTLCVMDRETGSAEKKEISVPVRPY
jgi:hypothetical protein